MEKRRASRGRGGDADGQKGTGNQEQDKIIERVEGGLGQGTQAILQ